MSKEVKNIYSSDQKRFDASLFGLNETILEKGFKKFKQKLDNKTALQNNNYYYINVWNIACKPCSDEMPFIDALTGKFKKDLACIMVSSHSDEAVNNFIRNKGIKMENFIFVNEMLDFISGIYNEIRVRNQSFPLHVVLDKKGDCLAYLFGAFYDEASAAPLINFINQLD